MEKLTLCCNYCEAEAEAPSTGWIAIRPAKKSVPNTYPTAPKADVCSLACLAGFIGTLSVPERLIPDDEAPVVPKAKRTRKGVGTASLEASAGAHGDGVDTAAELRRLADEAPDDPGDDGNAPTPIRRGRGRRAKAED